MCGIAGVSGGVIDRVRLQSATRLLLHRGPDSSGVHYAEADRIGLCHTRLSIQDLGPSGRQPMVDSVAGNVLVYNGEIYNYRELRQDLERRGVTFEGNSDSEVLLHLLRIDGVESLARLNGIFAFAFWSPSRGELVIARDEFGVKPLYFSQSGGQVVFASEMAALLALYRGPRTPDFAAIQRYVTFLWCPGAGTPLREVRKLEPGYALRVVSGEVMDLWQWAKPIWPGVVTGNVPFSRLAQATEDGLRAAVQRQMVSDVPLGAFLSGGLDSSAVVAFAREVDPRLECFTIEIRGSHADGLADDLPYARRVADFLNVHLNVVDVEANRMGQDLPGLISKLGEPLADPAALNVYYISELARRRGIKVLLSGAGGDDLFTGYRRHWAAVLDGPWQLLPRGMRHQASRLLGRYGQVNATTRRAAKFMDGAGLEGDDRLANFFHWAPVQVYRDLFGTQQSGQSYDRLVVDEPLLAHLDNMPAPSGSIDRLLAIEQRFFLPDHNLAYTDRMSMAAGVEVRVPFLDPSFARFAATIPSKYKQKGLTGKFILRRAMDGHLPSEIIHRPKTGFGAPIRSWFRGGLGNSWESYLSETTVAKRGFFDPGMVSDLVELNRVGRLDASYTLLSLVAVEIWFQEYYD